MVDYRELVKGCAKMVHDGAWTTLIHSTLCCTLCCSIAISGAAVSLTALLSGLLDSVHG